MKIYEHLRESMKIYENQPPPLLQFHYPLNRFSQIFVDLHRFSQIFVDVPKCSQIFVDYYRFSQIFIDLRRFSLIFIEALKIAENHEKPGFTFFAFLPPYIGVSGSLVSRKRQISMRSIDWYQKFLISCLVARYSHIFAIPARRAKGSPPHFKLLPRPISTPTR